MQFWPQSTHQFIGTSLCFLGNSLALTQLLTSANTASCDCLCVAVEGSAAVGHYVFSTETTMSAFSLCHTKREVGWFWRFSLFPTNNISFLQNISQSITCLRYAISHNGHSDLMDSVSGYYKLILSINGKLSLPEEIKITFRSLKYNGRVD